MQQTSFDYFWLEMNMQELTHQFTNQLEHTSLLETIAVMFGVISVLLASRNHVGLYPAGMISTGIYIYLMPTIKLYAEALLNGYYFIMSIYGWMLWQKNKSSKNPKAISCNTGKDWMITALIVVIGWIVFYTLLTNFTDSDVAAIDAIVSSTACAGMWLLANHKIENWILLNISNLIAIPLFLYKGIPLTALLTLFLFIVAIFGYYRWRKLYRLQSSL